MLLVRDGRQEAPKRKSVEARLQDLAAASAAIVTAKKKLETKAKELCVESASLASVLRLHADQWSEVENALKKAEQKSISYHVDAEAPYYEDLVDAEAPIREDGLPEDPAPAVPAVDHLAQNSAIANVAVGNDAGALPIAALPALPATAPKRKRAARKKPADNKKVDENFDEFNIDSPPRAQQIARAAGGDA